MNRIQKTLLASAISLASFQVVALPFTGVDARSISMGGTGVAAGSIVNASTFNPALLAASREDEDFNLSLAFGVVARDEDGMIDAIDEIQATNGGGLDKFQQFESDAAFYATSLGGPNEATAASNLTSSAQSLKDALNGLSNKPIELGVNVGFNVTIPSESLGMSVFANSRVLAAGSVNIAPSDIAVIDTALADVLALNPTSADPFAGDLASTLDLTGGAVTEVGVALATKIAGIAIGVTPKNLRIDTITLSDSVNATNTDNALDDTGESFEDVNFDVGIAIDLGALKIGAVGKNMIEQEYQIAGSPGASVVIEPQLRAGIAFDAGWATLTMDQDLTENKGIITSAAIGDSLDTQYTSLGIEFDLSLVQIRAGYRTNNLDSSGDSDVLTAGVGIHALVTLDVAVMHNEQGDEVVLQAGMRW